MKNISKLEKMFCRIHPIILCCSRTDEVENEIVLVDFIKLKYTLEVELE